MALNKVYVNNWSFNFRWITCNIEVVITYIDNIFKVVEWVEIYLGSNLLYNLQSLSMLLNGGIPCAILTPLFWFTNFVHESLGNMVFITTL
jgi:hypothetical protein